MALTTPDRSIARAHDRQDERQIFVMLFRVDFGGFRRNRGRSCIHLARAVVLNTISNALAADRCTHYRKSAQGAREIGRV